MELKSKFDARRKQIDRTYHRVKLNRARRLEVKRNEKLTEAVDQYMETIGITKTK